MSPTETTDLLVTLASGRAVTPDVWSRVVADDFWRAAERHGVMPLVAGRLSTLEHASKELRETARQLAHHEIAADLLNEAELRRLLPAVHRAGVRAVLMKGALLAYTHYSRPDLRPRLDTDILISASHRHVLHDVLVGFGYQPDIPASGDLVMYQRAYSRVLQGGCVHVVDAHWRLANPEVFRQVLSFDEITAAAAPVVQLGDTLGVSAVHALLIACVHRVAHHFDDDRLIWLYDIHLIASRLTSDEWSRFVELAIDRRVASICRVGLQRSVDRFGTIVPDVFWDRAVNGQEPELTAGYLTPNRPHMQAVIDDMRVMPRWTDRWRLMCEYAFPPVEYMREVYATSRETALPWLYLRRIFFGARKWLEHP